MKKSRIVKYLHIVILLLLIGFLFGCREQSDKNEKQIDGVNIAPYIEAEDLNVHAGDEITVVIRLKDYLPLMTMAVQIGYDTSVMDLTGIESGEDFRNFNFVKPKNITDGCMASWFRTDSDEIYKSEVELLVLKFQIHSDAVVGEYKIQLSCPNDLGIVDFNKKPVAVKSGTANIKII